MNYNNINVIASVEQLDSYINWLTENGVTAVYQGGSPEFSQEMSQLMHFFTQTGQFVQTQNHEQAIKRYAEILSRYPNFVAARYNLANCLKQLGKIEEALEQYSTATQYNPNDPALYIELGDVYYRLGQKGNEIVSYFQALVLTPERDVATLWKAIKNIGQTFGELREYQKSIKFLQMALEIALENSKYSFTTESWNNEFVATYLELGNTYKNMGNYQIAEKMYLEGVKVGAEARSASPELRYHETMIWSAITNLYLEHSNWSKAEQFAQKCVDRYPNEQLFQLKLRNAKRRTND